MMWQLAAGGRFDRRAVQLADRHYSRQKPGTPQFVRPGRCVVLLTVAADALWVSSWQRPEYVHHAEPGAWECALFRNENPASYRSSELIRSAVAATRYLWGRPPARGMVTFIDPARTRRKRDPGRCFLRAGWIDITPAGSPLVMLRQLSSTMPAPCAPIGELALEFTERAS